MKAGAARSPSVLMPRGILIDNVKGSPLNSVATVLMAGIALIGRGIALAFSAMVCAVFLDVRDGGFGPAVVSIAGDYFGRRVRAAASEKGVMSVTHPERNGFEME